MPAGFKKHGKKIFGVYFTADEQRVINEEIDRQWKEATIEYDKKHQMEICALVLWVLYEHFGFREKRLKKMFLHFDEYVADMLKRYQMTGPDDDVWLCTRRLKKAGYDIEAWAEENTEEQKMPNENTCVCCGAPIPEGRQVCPKCEHMLDEFNEHQPGYILTAEEMKKALERAESNEKRS